MSSMTSNLSFIVDKDLDGQVVQQLTSTELPSLVEGQVLVEVSYSSLNYKDALAATGHPGVALKLPLIPGIDAVGRVIESKAAKFKTSDKVIVGHAEFGTSHAGGWTQLTHVDADWCVPLPAGLTEREAVSLGTAGFTAAQSVEALIAHGVEPGDGPIAVSGSTGGVGILAVKLLSRLGYEVVASSGKQERADWLREAGATQVVSREEFVDQSDKPLLSAKWAGAVDTVGGPTLSTILRSTRPGGCVTACGLVAGAELNLTVFPFILRGVTLQGIDSANMDRERRAEIWERLAGEWKLDGLEDLTHEVPLPEVQECVERMLAGNVAGRIIVVP